MANVKKGEVSKSAQVRAILEKNPKTPVKEIVSALKAKGIKISDNLVYGIKAKLHHKKQKIKRQKAMATSQQIVGRNGTSPVDVIRKVRGLADEVGGIKSLKELVDILAE